MDCDHCGREIGQFEYDCSRCDGVFCSEHRLPESHDCIGLKVEKAERELKREEGQTEPWFDRHENQQGKRSRELPISKSVLMAVLILVVLGIGIAIGAVTL